MGIGKARLELCSVATSARVCRARNWSAPGDSYSLVAASASPVLDSSSPVAAITLALLSLSASA